MTHDEKIKFAYKTMLVNNPDEALKVLIMQDKKIDELNRNYLQEREQRLKAIEYINNLYDDEYISYGNKEEMLKIIEGDNNESN